MRSELTLLTFVLWATLSAAEKMVIGYFPNWLYANYPVERIPFDKYTHINYAFAILNTPDNLPSFTDDWAIESSLPKLINMSHQAGTKVLLSIGGWTGSQRFSPMVASAESRQKFIDWNLKFIDQYGIDGIDLDWEYPGRQAAGCNEYADNDADNLLLLLKELREALDAKYTEHKEISMAVHVSPFIKNGEIMTNVSDFVPYFDHINLMTYDINGAWAPVTGPNAPFKHVEGQGAPYSFTASIDAWKKAGVPANKIAAGLAFYGRSIQAVGEVSEASSQYLPAKVGAPKGDSDDAYWADPYCSKDTDGMSGVWKWTNLRSEGLILDDLVTAGHGWQRHWDDVSKTPWLYNPESKIYISYDDPQSLQFKVDYALCEDLAGVMVWDIHQDNGELLSVAHRMLGGLPSTCTFEQSNPADASPVTPSSTIGSAPASSAASSSFIMSSYLSRGTNVPSSAPKIPSGYSSHDFTSTSHVVAPPNTTPVASNGPVAFKDNEPCPVPGQQVCIANGHAPEWLTCNFGRWVQRSCVTGTVCHDENGQLYCDFPRDA